MKLSLLLAYCLVYLSGCASDIVTQKAIQEQQIKEQIKAHPEQKDSLLNISKKVWDF